MPIIHPKGAANIIAVSHQVHAVYFDGADWLRATDGTLGITTDSKLATLSFWINLDVGIGGGGNDGLADGVGGTIHSNTNFYIGINRNVSNKITFSANTSTPSMIVSLTSNSSIVRGGGWRHIFVSFDLNTPEAYLYIDGVADLAPGPTIINNSPDWTRGEQGIGVYVPPLTTSFKGGMSEFYLAQTQFVDPATGIDKFISGGKPVDLGAIGDLPTGTSPKIYLNSQVSSTWNQNAGTGGDFTMTGTLTNAASSPSN